MLTTETRCFIKFQNLGIAMRNAFNAMGDAIAAMAPAFRQFADHMGVLYERLQRIRVYQLLPTWLPYREQIADHWPKWWLPSSASMMRWIEEGGTDAN
jgi:hypothetical protein